MKHLFLQPAVLCGYAYNISSQYSNASCHLRFGVVYRYNYILCLVHVQFKKCFKIEIWATAKQYRLHVGAGPGSNMV